MQQELKYIYQIYLDGSFTKAAEHLYITQPALSIAISKIEESLNMALFDRHRHPLQPTAAGMAYIETIRKIIDLECQLNDMKELNCGTLTIGGSHYLNAYILPDILTGFCQKYPGIQIQLVEAGSSVLAEMLSDRKLDFTFSCNKDFIQNFERYAVFDDYILLAVPKTYEINKRLAEFSLSASAIIEKQHLSNECPSLHLSEFRELEYLLLNKGNNMYECSMAMFQDAGFTPKIKMTISQLVTAYHLAEHNFAATFVCDKLVRNPTDPLVFYKIKSDLNHRSFYLLLTDHAYTSLAAKAFIQYFSLHMEKIVPTF